MATFSPQEVHIPLDGQTDIKLSHPYEMDKHAISVYLNGMLSPINFDYIELDQYTIRFKFQLSSEDVVITQQSVWFDDKVVSVIGEKDAGLFSKYGAGKRLLENQKYTAIFKYADQTFTTSFFTKMSPMFSSVSVIKSDMADAFDSFDINQLMMQIYLNSVLALNIAGETQLEEINTAMTAKTQLPYYAKQFVRYRTELDMMTALWMSLSKSSGTSEKKTLGELSVERRNSFLGTQNIEPFLSDLKEKSKTWEKLLRGGTTSSPMATAVRGGSSYAYPLTSPRIGSWGS